MRSRLAKHKTLALLLILGCIFSISFAAFKSINHFHPEEGLHAEKVSVNEREPEIDDFEWLWEYDQKIYDLSPEALLGDRNEFETWKKLTEPSILNFFDKVEVPRPDFQSISNEGREEYGFDLKSITFTFPGGVFNLEKDMKTLLALPSMPNASSCKPISLQFQGMRSPLGEKLLWQYLSLADGDTSLPGPDILCMRHPISSTMI